MRNPVNRTTRLLGSASVVGLASLAAATAQVQEKRDVEVERVVTQDGDTETYRFEAREEDGVRWMRFGDADDVKTYRVGGEDAHFVLLSDPFSELVPPAPEAPSANSSVPPAPPAPPLPRLGTRDVEQVVLRLPEGMDLDGIDFRADQVRIEDTGNGGRQVTLTNPADETMDAIEETLMNGSTDKRIVVRRKVERSDGDFAFEMERYNEEMEAFGEEMDRFGDTMEDFGDRMGAFGEEMGAWGARMGEVGGAVGRLADACDAHIAKTDDPAVLIEAVGADEIKAVCASGGGARYQSGELTRFVRRHDDLTRAEKRAFLENRDAKSVVSVNR